MAVTRRRLLGSMGLVLVAPRLARAQRRSPRRVGVVHFRGGLMNRDGAHGIAFVAAMKDLGPPSIVAAKSVTRERDWPGALLRYGPNLSSSPRRAAAYVARIFKGAKPADMPVEQPDKYDFIVDLAAAQMLGVKLPASLLARADRVLE